jgi:hypothetical protein
MLARCGVSRQTRVVDVDKIRGGRVGGNPSGFLWWKGTHPGSFGSSMVHIQYGTCRTVYTSYNRAYTVSVLFHIEYVLNSFLIREPLPLQGKFEKD